MYTVFMIDPPWPKKKGGKRKSRPNQGRELDYQTMPIEDIFNLLDLKIFVRAEETHTVFMWTVEQFLAECDAEMKKRGYRRHVRLIWDKTNGVAPAFTVRFSHEYLIWYYKPKMLKIDERMRGKVCSVIKEKAREHSRKPDKAYDIINSFYPKHKKYDVFSREKRPGWDQFGNQTGFFNSTL